MGKSREMKALLARREAILAFRATIQYYKDTLVCTGGLPLSHMTTWDNDEVCLTVWGPREAGVDVHWNLVTGEVSTRAPQQFETEARTR